MDTTLSITCIIVIAPITAIVWMAAARVQRARRQKKILDVVGRLKFSLQPARSRSTARGLEYLRHITRHSHRFAQNIIRGKSPQGGSVLIFDYHYRTSAAKRSPRNKLSIFLLTLPKGFAELMVEARQTRALLSHVPADEDIDFPADEFSRRFRVCSKDGEFSRLICNNRMIDYLMKHPEFNIELNRDTLALIFDKPLSPSTLEIHYSHLLQIRDIMPPFLFD